MENERDNSKQRTKEMDHNDFDHSRLAALYPQPKTAEELRERQPSLIRHVRHEYARITLLGSLVFSATLLFSMNIPTLWQNGNIGLIFFSFALWLGIGTLAVIWIKQVNTIFYSYGRSTVLFWTFNGVLDSLLAGVLLYSWQYVGSLPTFLLLGLGVAHLVSLVLFVRLRGGLRED